MVTPLITVAVFYIIGVVSGFYFFIPLEFSFAILILSFFIAFFLSTFSKENYNSPQSPFINADAFGYGIPHRKHREGGIRGITAFLFLSTFLAGFVLCQLHLCPVSGAHIKNFVSPWEVGLTGTVIEEPELKGDRLSFLLKCEKYAAGFRNDTGSYPVRGMVKVNYSSDENTDLRFTYGDRVLLIGRLQEPTVLRNPVLFNYETYLRNKGIFAVFHCVKIDRLGKGRVNIFSRFAFRLRCSLKDSVERTLPQEEGGLLKGVMLGDKEDIAPDLRDAFVSTGLAHTLAVSGLHVGLVASIFYFFLRFLKLPRKVCSVFNIPAVIFYCLITGANPPAVRATILSVVMLSAVFVEREPDLLNSLAFAALIILLMNPLSLFDASFQLSFTATLGIIYLVPFFEKCFKPVLPRWIVIPLSVSISAQICVAPLAAYYFNKVSIVALIANLFVVPVLGIILTLGFVSAILGLVCFSLAKFAATANFACLWYFIQAIKFFGSFPLASLNVATPSPIFIGGYYAAIFTPRFKYGKRVFLGLLAALAIFIWSKILVVPVEENLEIIFFDVGQGQSVFIRLPSRESVLIDGGTLSGGEYVLSPFLRGHGICKLDAVISTHSHADHMGGLIPVIDDFKVGNVLAGEVEDSSAFSSNFWQIVRQKKLLCSMINCGDELRIGNKLKIKVLNPLFPAFSDKDNNSLVLKLIYGKFAMLMPSDVRSKVQDGFIEDFSRALGADVLQVPHHGSAEALNADFLNFVKPRVAVMQLGRFNQFRFPGPGVIETYEKMGIKVYRTDRDGAIRITTDGNTYAIKAYSAD